MKNIRLEDSSISEAALPPPLIGYSRQSFSATGGATVKSAWQPTPAQIEAIVAGAPVILTLAGTHRHGVVLDVGQPSRPR